MQRTSSWTLVLLAALIIPIVAALAGGTASAARWGKNYFPNLPVVTQDGETLNFYDDLIKGKIVIIDFIYTNCPDICSLTTARMAAVQDRLGDRLGRDIFIYSISLDPEQDTPEKLKKYAEAFGAKPGWLFLTGKPQDLKLIRWKLGERSRNLREHIAHAVIGNDTTGEWQKTSMMSEINLLVYKIFSMDPVWRAQPRKIAKSYATASSYKIGQRGQALYLKACALCHTIGGGDRVGPDLNGVTERRDRDWLVRYMMDPDGMRARKDPIALEIDAKYDGVRMPDLDLSKDDAADLLAYVESQMKLLVARAGTTQPHDHSQHRHN